ncbi:MAG TPA: hypothetical protein VM802_03975 [Chitinophaga sp.]|uniref:hypothetical protein n=1 Tax=Chitinophaga sp. TaxID=1869181 RepID=UPI002CB775FF|nr:hypothetical protein [Chitinophaga sp.]HVI43994.1 hypothetical protein [Chitinophaga sp.]
MKKATAIFLLFLYLFGSTDACQILRLPLLVKHYEKHKCENADLTLAAFLKMHYIDEQPFDSDYLQDMQLPFKSPDVLCISLPTLVPVPVTLYVPLLELPKESYIVMNDCTPLHSFPGNIFQPPKA